MMPDLITNAKPGELFTIRNVGNFVPPYKPSDDYHGTAAGIEYAISVLNVNNIIVCGHSYCGACEAIYDDDIQNNKELVHIKNWLKINNDVKEDVLTNYHFDTTQEKLRITERVSVIHQLGNLLSYPKVKQRVDDGSLKLHGWYYLLESGKLEAYNASKHKFELVD
jgi:carbonic anhydrase